MPISPISSKNNTPVSASSNLPIFLFTEPVYAPFSEPKSSLSISSVGTAEQFISTNGLSERLPSI